MSFQVAVFSAATHLNQGVGSLFGATTPPKGPTEPQLRPGLDPTDVSPGLLGFVFMFVLAVAVIFMMLSMNKKMRKVSHSTDSSHRVTAEFDGERPTRRPRPSAAASAADSAAASGDASVRAAGVSGEESAASSADPLDAARPTNEDTGKFGPKNDA